MDTMEETIPVVDSLHHVYPSDTHSSQEKRWQALKDEFQRQFGFEAAFVARSPGRVNIIGEHIDYSLYDVLPMGIAADVIIAVGVRTQNDRGGEISVANVNSSKYKPATIVLGEKNEVDIDASAHEWSNYFKAGLYGAIKLLSEGNASFRCASFCALVDGSVPAGGGLSSSAAFVCASALASLYANGRTSLKKKELTELAIVSERAVGVNSGGMDQAASVCSVRGDALHVSFSPQLRAEAIAFPKVNPSVTFMIAQSLVTSDKHVTAPVCYNLRVVEVTFAALYLAACYNLSLASDNGPLGYSLHGFEHAFFASEHADKQSSAYERAQKMLALTRDHLSAVQGYTRSDIASKLGISEADLEERYLRKIPVRAERFQLRQRAEHVFSEVLRVHEFITVLDKNNQSTAELSTSEGSATLKQMGALMNQTQISCRDSFDCSCPELDEMCQLAVEAGAYGSRLTGAGWGGCSVHLVPRDRVDEIRQAWITEYYQKRKKDDWAAMSEEDREGCIVVTEPGVGSMVVVVAVR